MSQKELIRYSVLNSFVVHYVSIDSSTTSTMKFEVIRIWSVLDKKNYRIV